MKKLLLATVAAAAFATTAVADEVKIGIIVGFTGPIESLAVPMAEGAELAMKEITDSGALLGGMTMTPVRADSTCIDNAAAQSAAERLITSDGIAAIMGADCSGVTTAILKNVAMPNGIVMISPSATSPALSTMEDDGLFFRTAPSDAREGEVDAQILKEHGVKSIAMTYTNNDYGKGLSDSIKSSFEKLGGKVTIDIPHEDGKADYSAEVASLASAGGDILVVAGYLDQGGKGIIQASLDTGAFDKFFLPGGMIGESLPKAIGPALDGSYGAIAGTDSPGMKTFSAMAKEAGFDGTSPYTPEAYDAAALLAFAMQAAKSTKSADFKSKVMDVANAPGEKIFPGELAKGLKIIADGGDIDYVGASSVELVGGGESAGNYREIVVKDEQNVTVGFR